MSAYVNCVRCDAAFHGFVAAYALVALLVGIAAGVPHKFVPLSYVGTIARYLPHLVLLVLVGVGLCSLRSPTPLGALGRTLRKAFGPSTVAGLLLFASLSICLGVFSSIKTMLTDIVPFFADPFLADLDSLLHGRDPWLYGSALMRREITATLEFLYFGVWSALVSGTLLAVLVVPKLREMRTQYVWTVLLVWPLLGNVMAGTLMSAGPVYYELVTGDARFAGLVHYLAHNSLAQTQAQSFLWNSYVTGEAGAGSGISAFPSLHLANATLCVLLGSRVHRWLMGAALVYGAVILFGSVHLGWHYAVDGYFSIAATVLIWKAVGWALKPKPLIEAALA